MVLDLAIKLPAGSAAALRNFRFSRVARQAKVLDYGQTAGLTVEFA